MRSAKGKGEIDLMEAAFLGDIEVVKTLLNHGADVNARGKHGETALMMATRSGHLEVVKTLLAHGADVNARDNYSDTALSLASNKGYSEIAQILKQAGAEDYIKKSLTQPKEKILFLTGITTLLELLCPPWIFKNKGYESFLGFHPIWKTNVNGWGATIDSSLLIIEFIITIFVGLSIYLLAKSQKEKTQ